MDEGPGRGARDNGLRCGNYVAVADLDPRVAEALLATLRDEGIAAYAAPTPGETGGYGERRLPPRPVDRLWVDDQRVERAREIVQAETHHHEEPPGAVVSRAVDPVVAEAAVGTETSPDLETAWQQVLASLQSTVQSPVPPWPVSEDLDPVADAGGRGLESHIIRPAAGDSVGSRPDPDDEEDEHFVPPSPPPLPRLQPATVLSLVTIAFGLLVLATQWDGGAFNVIGVVCVIGGVANLVYHMRQGPPTDSGWDDGAVV